MKTKIKNAPKKIYLNLGNDMGIDDTIDFGAFSEVTWCQYKISDNDIEYCLCDQDVKDQIIEKQDEIIKHLYKAFKFQSEGRIEIFHEIRIKLESKLQNLRSK
jgi:hypothetical protein